jgi:hypothetical protein
MFQPPLESLQLIDSPTPFKWHHFLPDVILLNVRWYCRYSLSYRDLEEMNMIRKGQIKDIEKGDVIGQISFINEIFGVAA